MTQFASTPSSHPSPAAPAGGGAAASSVAAPAAPQASVASISNAAATPAPASAPAAGATPQSVVVTVQPTASAPSASAAVSAAPPAQSGSALTAQPTSSGAGSIPYVPVSQITPSGGQSAVTPALGSSTSLPPSSPPPARAPAPFRMRVQPHLLPLPGLREIPDNLLIPCYFPEELDANLLEVGDRFTVAVFQPRSQGRFGSATHMTTFPPDTLIEFVVVRKQMGGTPNRSQVLVRASAILIPHPHMAGWDIEIPVATASLLDPSEAGPCEDNRFESAHRAERMGSALGMVMGQDAHYYFLFGSIAQLAGYAAGRMKEDAAGVSFLEGAIPAGAECVVRINRRILIK